MSVDYQPVDTALAGRRKSPLPMILLLLLTFLLGLAFMGWLLASWDQAAKFVGVKPAPAPAADVAPAAQQQAVAPVAPAQPGTERLVIDPEITRRVTQLEQQLGALSNQSRAAIGNADRAEGLLVAFAARRALDRGVSLGYLENLLRQRFAETQPAAVATIITAARQPVTLEDLQEGLQEVAPDLVAGGTRQDWFTALRRELSGLIIVRKAGTPSTIPAERLRRATRRLEAGQVDVALAEVLRMPGRERADQWTAAARRYVEARRALDTVETAALNEPRLSLPPPPAVLPPPAR